MGLDMSKEILIAREKVIDGRKTPGFDVYNPLYCLEGGHVNFKGMFMKEGKPAKLDRAGIIVCRGWIPHNKRDRKSRPEDMNTRQLIRLDGVFRRGKNLHDYDQCKYYYFDCVDLEAADGGAHKTSAKPKTK